MKIKKLHPEVKSPVRATEASIGLDIYAHLISETGRPNNMLLPPRSTRAVPTGLVFEPPTGYSIYVCSRSGMAKEGSIFVTNSPGVVDPDYRGELMVLLYNGGFEAHYIRHQDRVGQIVLLPTFICPVVEAEIDLNTERGTSGFGSTGR